MCGTLCAGTATMASLCRGTPRHRPPFRALPAPQRSIGTPIDVRGDGVLETTRIVVLSRGSAISMGSSSSCSLLQQRNALDLAAGNLRETPVLPVALGLLDPLCRLHEDLVWCHFLA